MIPPPKPLTIVVKDDQLHSFTLVRDALQSVLLRQEVANVKVAIISIAGASRKGKSFLLNFFLRFLQIQVFTCEYSGRSILD